MFCTRCGAGLTANDKFCSHCGANAGRGSYAPAVPGSSERLSRPRYDKKIAGVCSGFARYLGLDVSLVRILWIVFIFWPIPFGLIAYFVAWIVMPRDPIALPAGTWVPAT